MTADLARAELSVVAAGSPVLSKSFAGPVLPGGTVQMTFSLSNSGSSAVSDLAFTDDLGAMVTGAVATSTPISACGGTLSGSSSLTYSGGTLAAGETCNISVQVQVTSTAIAGTYPNTTSALSRSGVFVSPAATASLTVEPRPTLAKAYAPSSIEQGGTSVLTLTLDNSSALIAATGATTSVTVPSGLSLQNGASTSCGGTLTAAAGAAVASLSGGTIPAGGTCQIDLPFDVSASSNLTLTTVDLTSDLGNSGTASATLTVTGAPLPGFAMAFAPDSMVQGGVSTLSYTVDNTSALVAAGSLSFTNALPTGLSVAATPNVTNSCSGGSVSAAAGATSVSYSGGSVAGGASCVITVDVTSSTVGAATSTSGDLTSDLGNSGTASATLTVTGAPLATVSAAFSPSTITEGGVSTLTIALDNASALIDATAANLNVPLPTGVRVAAAPAASNTCGGTWSTPANSAAASLSGGTIPASGSCQVSVAVTTNTTGTATLTTGTLVTSLGTSGTATAALTVNSAPVLTMAASFSPASVPQGEKTRLTYVISNTNANIAATNVTFTDILATALEFASQPNATSTCGGSISVTGGNRVELTNGVIPAGSSCTISVDVIAKQTGNVTNTADGLGSSHGTSLTAGAVLQVTAPVQGQITIVQTASQDGLFSFTSAESALNFAITTSGGTGQFGPVRLAAGTYVVAQSRPAGVGNTSLTCSDGDSAGDSLTGRVIINLQASENVVCSYASVNSRQVTSETINGFLNRRIDRILSSEPARSRRIARLNGGVGGSRAVSFARGDLRSLLPISIDPQSFRSNNFSASGSMSELRAALARHPLSLDGSDGDTTRIDNPRWDAWFELQYSQFDASSGTKGHFGIGYIGADYLVSEDLLVGAMLQIDDLSERSTTLNNSISGRGWMFGPYVTARLAPKLYFDGRFAYGKSKNKVSPFNSYTDTFETSRWLVNASVTGEVDVGAWKMQPNAKLSYMQEIQESYVDGLNVTIPSQKVSQGQFRFGPNFSTSFIGAGGIRYEPHFTFDGIYSFGVNSGASVTSPTSKDTLGLRGRIEAGIAITNPDGARMEFGLNYDGIGKPDFEAFGASFKLSIQW